MDPSLRCRWFGRTPPVIFHGHRVSRTRPRHSPCSVHVPTAKGRSVRKEYGDLSGEELTQNVEQPPAACLAVRAVGPELVEEDAVLDVREPSAVIDRFEF